MSAECDNVTPHANPCEYCDYAEQRDDSVTGNTYLACARDTIEEEIYKRDEALESGKKVFKKKMKLYG